MKTIKVVAAIIIDNHQILATQRGYGEQKGGWEFPGGKIEKGETAEVALIREIEEELSLKINVDRYFANIEYDYEKFHLSMACYLCSIKEGYPILKEHEALRWLNKKELHSLNWLEADLTIIADLEKLAI